MNFVFLVEYIFLPVVCFGDWNWNRTWRLTGACDCVQCGGRRPVK